jgi:hypothetical protein
MAAFAGALGSLAESYGLAREQVMEERRQAALTRLDEERMRQEQVRTQFERERLQMERDLANRPMFLGQPYSRGGKRYIQQWSPQEGKLGEVELGEEESALQKYVRERTAAGYGKPTEEQIETEFYKVKPGTTTAATTSEDEINAYYWHYAGLVPTGEKAQAGAKRVMLAKGWGPGRKPTGMEQRTIEQTKVAEDLTRQLRKFIEDNKLTESDSWGTLARRYLVSGEYLAGRKPQNPIDEQLTLVSSAVSYLGTLPYMQGGRGKAYMEVIGQHMPHMRDTPANMYSKSKQMLQILDKIKKDVSTRGEEWTPGAPGSMEPPAMEEAPGGGGELVFPAITIPPEGGAAPQGRQTVAPPSRMPIIHFNEDGSMEIR